MSLMIELIPRCISFFLDWDTHDAAETSSIGPPHAELNEAPVLSQKCIYFKQLTFSVANYYTVIRSVSVRNTVKSGVSAVIKAENLTAA